MEKSRHTHPLRAILAASLSFVMLAMLLLLMAPKASAATAVADEIWLGGVRVTDANKDDILAGTGMTGRASYDPDTKTLTLDGVHIDKEHVYDNGPAYGSRASVSLLARSAWTSGFTKSELKIVLKGKNSLDIEAAAGKPVVGMSISDKLNFQITGTGSLTVTATNGGTNEAAHGLSIYDNTGAFGTQDAASGPTITIHGDKSAVDCRSAKPANSKTLVLYSGNLSLTSKTSTPIEDPGGGAQLCVTGGSLKVKTDMPQTNAYAVLNGIWAESVETVILPGSNGGQHSAEDGLGGVDIDRYPYVIGTWIGYGKAGDYLMVPGQAKDLDPSDPVREETDAEGNTTEVGTYKDPTINVLGFTEDATVYSVDVEWGAMTFQYEKSLWDPETHLEADGRGWMVYDTEKQAPLPDDTQNAINCVTVTNHSNAGVYAALSYAGLQDGTQDYTKITGTFTKKDDDTATVFNTAGNYLTLATADNDKQGPGKGEETVGKVYFMPQDDTATDPGYTTKDQEIAKWQKIGKITVQITTTQPD